MVTSTLCRQWIPITMLDQVNRFHCQETNSSSIVVGIHWWHRVDVTVLQYRLLYDIRWQQEVSKPAAIIVHTFYKCGCFDPVAFEFDLQLLVIKKLSYFASRFLILEVDFTLSANNIILFQFTQNLIMCLHYFKQRCEDKTKKSLKKSVNPLRCFGVKLQHSIHALSEALLSSGGLEEALFKWSE